MKTNNFKSLSMLLLVAIAFSFSSQNIFAQNNSDITGVWKMRGYGWIFEVTDTEISIYDQTKVSCLPAKKYPTAIIDDKMATDNTLTLKIGISTYTLDRLTRLPEICVSKLTKKQKKDPFYNFDVLWNTFNDHYAYFELRGIDWKKSYDTYRNKITDKTSDAELFAIFYEMLETFDDGHVDIEAPDKIMEKAVKILNETSQPDQDIKKLYTSIFEKYIPKHNTHNFTRTVWGKITDKVGYIQVNSMSTQSYYGLTEKMSEKEATKVYLDAYQSSQNPMQDEVDGINKTMQRIRKDFGDIEHVILDVRFNGGGYDTVSFKILEYFANQPFTAFRKQARDESSSTSSYTYTLKPTDNTFKAKLYILQSYWSASAVETMLLASLQLDHVSRIGSSSEGILSDALEKVLPNGWTFTLSNEAYLTPEGKNYEVKGIPVDVDLGYPKNSKELYKMLAEELKTTGDRAIEHVLKVADRP